jgi:hypothetical protein
MGSSREALSFQTVSFPAVHQPNQGGGLFMAVYRRANEQASSKFRLPEKGAAVMFEALIYGGLASLYLLLAAHHLSVL